MGELEALRRAAGAGSARLVAALLGQVDVGPAREEVLEIPGALAVADQDELAGHVDGLSARTSWRTACNATDSVGKSAFPVARISFTVWRRFS